jgi:hypothetical protein
VLIVVPFDLEKCKNEELAVEFAMDANTAALNLIQKWVGSDDKITDMSAFYDALVKALEDAHLEGEEESRAEDTIGTEPTFSPGET